MWHLLVTTLLLYTALCGGSVSAAVPPPHTPASSEFPESIIHDILLKVIHRSRSPAPALFLLTENNVRLARLLSRARVAARIVHPPSAWLESLESLDKGAGSLNIVLDTAGRETAALLAEANSRNLFTTPRRWVLFNLERSTAAAPAGHDENVTTTTWNNATTGTALRLADDSPRDATLASCFSRTTALLQGLTVFFDSDVTALCRLGPGTAGSADASAVAVSAYRLSAGSPLKLRTAAKWRGGLVQDVDKRPVPGRRLDMHGYVVNTAFVVFHPEDLQRAIAEGDVTADYLSTFFWELSHDMVKAMNATMNVTVTKTWGYVKTGEPKEGLFGMLIKKEIEVAGSGFSQIIDPLRSKYITFTGFYCPLRGVIGFRSPPLSYENNVFTLPFPPSLWAASAVLVAICCILLTVVMHAENAMGITQRSRVQALHSGSDAVILAVGAVCQQGSPVEARGVPGRTITLLLFVVVLLLYTCYSASIVVLLQSSATSITHFRDLLNSQIKMGMTDVPYALHYTRIEPDPVRQRVFREKLVDKKSGKPVLLTEKDGARKMRTERFAFLGLEGLLYKEISRTWQEHEKCGLVFLHDYLRVKDPNIAIRKTSHNSKAFTIVLRKLQERGIRNRVSMKYMRTRPVCQNSAALFHSVSLTDCRGAFEVLGSLAVVAVLTLLVELVAHRRGRKSTEEERTEAWSDKHTTIAALAGKLVKIKF